MLLAAGAGGVWCACRRGRASSGEPLIERVEVSVIWEGRKSGGTWFHPRACRLPGDPPRLLMAVQQISGSDVFGPVHWSESTDLGRSWSTPRPIPGLGRRQHPGGIEEGVCDVVPDYHAPTGTVLFLGHNVYYRDGRLTRPNEQRRPIYVIRRPDGAWSEPKRLQWQDPEASAIYTSNCSQRVMLPGGDVLLPLSFGPRGRQDRAVTTALCSFDGEELRIRRTGTRLRLAVKRGLLEPSLTQFGGRYYMTIRAEDGRGYVTASEDGLSWAPLRPWSFQDGEPLVMSTTQQHWLAHSDGPYLAYTRKTEANANVFRWRAPLFAARFDHERLALWRQTEIVLIPMSGDGVNAPDEVARMGNFHPVAASESESLVTVGETLPSRGWLGNTLQARIFWKRPNRLVS